MVLRKKWRPPRRRHIRLNGISKLNVRIIKKKYSCPKDSNNLSTETVVENVTLHFNGVSKTGARTTKGKVPSPMRF